MKLSEFIFLDDVSMKTTVLHNGVLVAKRKNQDYMVFLFQLDDFYVETYCNIRDKAVCEYRAFKNINSLAPYLEKIEIDDLLPGK